MKKLSKRQQARYFRAAVQAAFFLLFPSVFAAAFGGVKEIFLHIYGREPIAFSAFLAALAALCLYTAVFGRFFCGYGCAFGTLGDAIYGISSWAQKKWKKHLPQLPEKAACRLRYLKYAVLLAIVLSCALGKYDWLMKGRNPWDVFSMAVSGNLRLQGYGMAVGILLAILCFMAFGERFFCRFLCPMGAVFSLLPVLPSSLYRRDRENCIPGCRACKMNCPARLDIDGDSRTSGECFQCGRCAKICPKGNIRRGAWETKRRDILLLLIKIAVLAIICWRLF